jgi:phage terminase large subunit GpA-like protein
MTSVLNPTGLARLERRTRKLLAPRPRYKVSEWAEARLHLPREGNAEPGKYHVARCPYQGAMLDDAVDPAIVEAIWVMAKQVGKTACFVGIVGYFIDYDPSSILVVYPTLDSAKAWSKEKFNPTCEATPCLHERIRPPRTRDTENTILNKRFRGGNITVAGANSPSTLRQRSKRVILQDEIDAYEPNQEGDPIAQADGRAETFHNAVKLKSTTPTIKGLSRSEVLWHQSDQQQWFVPCPRCGQWQTLKWSQIKFEFEQPDGTTRRAPEDAVYVCSFCQSHLSDAERLEAIQRGQWRPTAPFRGTRGRHLNGLYRVLGKKDAYRSYLHEFVEEFLKAKHGGPFSLMVWVNTFLAEWYEEERERIESGALEKRREDYTGIPDKVLVLTAGVDIQGDRAEVDVVGWAEGEESWGIEHRIIPGNPLQHQLWVDLGAWLDTAAWRNRAGLELRIAAAAVDTGFATDQVYQFCRPRFARRIYAVKGSNVRAEPIVGHLSRANRRRCPVYRIGTDTAKRQLYGRLRLLDAGPGYCHFTRADGAGYDEGYFQQLTSEEMRTRYVKGFPISEFVLPEGRRNEALDCRVYASAALVILSPSWSALRAAVDTRLAALGNKPEGPTGAAAEPRTAPGAGGKPNRPTRPSRARGGFVGGWK